LEIKTNFLNNDQEKKHKKTSKLYLNEKVILFVTAVFFISFYLWKEYALNGRLGFPLDDSWIHLQFAKNIGLGQGFSYNAGIPVAGSTAPLWTFILSVPFALSINPVFFSKAVGVFFYLLSLFFLTKISDYLLNDKYESFFISAVFILVPIFTWSSLSGMEILLFTALTLAGIHYHISTRNTSKKFLSTFLLSAAGFARPECFILAPLIFIDDIFLLFFYKRNKTSFFYENLTRFAIWLSFVLLFFWFNYSFDGNIFPNTFYAKSAVPASGGLVDILTMRILYGLRKVFYTFLFWFYNTNFLFFCAFFLGLFGYVYDSFKGGKPKTLLPILLIFLYPFTMGAVSMGGAPDTIGRYITHLSVFFTFISAYGVLFIRRRFVNKHFRSAIVSVFYLVLFLWFINFSHVYAQYVKNINDMQVTIGEWVALNTKEDDVVALNDVGAVKYITGRNIIDVWGLVTTEILPYIKKYPYPDGMLRYILEKKPDYLIVFPSWYSIIPTLNDTFSPVFNVKLENNYVCGGEEMVVYKCNWKNTKELDRYLLGRL